MHNTLQYIVALGFMTLIVKIVYDWLKGRNNRSFRNCMDYVTKGEWVSFEKMMESKFGMMMAKMEKIEDRLDRLYEKLANMECR